MGIMKKILVILLFFVNGILFAQNEVKTVDGKKFYAHKIEPNQTLYSIHKLYNVTVSDIKKANENMTNNLSVGQVILIPIDINDNKHYQNHVISKGETLYGVSKKYNCSVSDLKIINPELLESSIQIGQIIRVPFGGNVNEVEKVESLIEDAKDETIESDMQGKSVTEKDSIVYHVVLKHETLYAISKRYMVTADQIRKINDINFSSLKAGDIIKVPVKKVNYSIVENEVDMSLSYLDTLKGDKSIIKKETYKVAIVLPFMFSKNQANLNRSLKIGELRKLYLTTNISSGFYHGFMMAADSLAKAGMNIEISIFDSKKDTNAIKSIIDKKGLNEMDLIFGPVYPLPIKYLSRFCKEQSIPMVIPFNSGTKILYDNPYVYKTTASNMSQIDGMIDFVSEDYSKYNLLIIKPKSSSKDIGLYNRAVERFNNVNSENKLQKIELGSSSGRDLNLKLRKDTVNIIIVPSTDVVFVTSVFRRVNNVLNMNVYSKRMKVVVFGLEDWNRISEIDVKHRERTNQHYVSYRFIDYENLDTKKFILNFRSKYGTEPQKYDFQGFDVGYYFLSALYLYGSNFDSYLNQHKIDLIQNSFEFESVSNQDGKENTATCVVKYEDYQLKFIRW